MEIRETNLIFTRRLIRRRTTTQIVIHHTASGDVSAETVHGWHLQNLNWGGIGYHYLVRANGGIERGRPEEVRGVHASRANANSIAIALSGNFSRNRPTIQQMDSIVSLVRDIWTRYSSSVVPALPVVRHADLSVTECPGLLFPWNELHRRLLTRDAE
jgi:N-acetyl-anhydromuramyl-L-alanine amidase AmpD